MMRFLSVTATMASIAAMTLMSPDGTASAQESTPAVQTTGSIQVLDRGGDATSGWIEYTGTGTVTVEDSAIARGYRKVGGGTWSYGVNIFTSDCFSSYKHPTKYHSATAISESKKVKRSASAGYWAKASTPDVGTCRAYWSTT